MITIRYADLPEGLHARAESRGRRTIIYLRPGLTPEQRRESLRRARQSGRMGHGPRLSASGVAFAVARLTCRTTVRNAAAAGRRHPLTSVLLLAVLSAAVVCYLLFVTVSIRFLVSPGWALSPHGPLPGALHLGEGRRDDAGRRESRLAGGTRAGPVPGGHTRARGRAPGATGGSRPHPSPSSSPSPSPRPSGTRLTLPSPSPSPSRLCLLDICL
jgi:hypothetical protein